MGRSSPSVRPALVVIGIAVVICAFGAVIALLGGRTTSGTPVTGTAHKVAGTNLSAVPASLVLHHIESAGQPPRDIVAALTVPAGSKFLGTSGSPSALDQFDRTVTLQVDAPASEVVRFYLTEMSLAKWIVESDSSPRAGVQMLLGQHPGSDGYEWLVGVKITAYSPTVAPALAGGDQSSASCVVAIRLEQQGDVS